MPLCRAWTSIRPVVLQVFFDEVLKEWTLLLGWSTISSLGSFGLFPGQHFLGNCFGDLPYAPGIALTTGLKIVVPTLPTLIDTHTMHLCSHREREYNPFLRPPERLEQARLPAWI